MLYLHNLFGLSGKKKMTLLEVFLNQNKRKKEGKENSYRD